MKKVIFYIFPFQKLFFSNIFIEMGNNIINKKIKILNQEYLITKLLGKGFFGDVFEGKNMNTNKFVAIK